MLFSFAAIFASCESLSNVMSSGAKFTVTVRKYPAPVQKINAYANFRIDITSSDKTKKYWLECVPDLDPNLYHYNGCFDNPYNAKNLEVGAKLTEPGKVTRWRVNIRENSKKPGAPILFTKEVNFTVVWK